MAEHDNSNLEFGRVLEGGTGERKIWFIIIPAVLGLGALLVFAGLAIAKSGGLESQVKLADQRVEEANKAVSERDELLKKARADEAVLRSPGQGVSVMAAAQPKSPASGVAMIHPEHGAVKLYVFGLEHPQAGQEYRVEVIGPDKQRKQLGRIAPDDRGTGFLLAKDVPEGSTAVEVVLAAVTPNGEGASAKVSGEAGAQQDAQGAEQAEAKAEEGAAEDAAAAGSTLILAGDFPAPGTAGVVQAPTDLSQRAQARTPSRAARRPMR